MAGTTISVSDKFHEWLKGKGKKGESYEDIIKKMLRQEFLNEVESASTIKKGSPTAETQKGKKDTKRVVERLDATSSNKPKQEKVRLQVKYHKSRQVMNKPLQKTKIPKDEEKKDKSSKTTNETASNKFLTKPKKINDGYIKQERIEKSIELQRLEVEFELAKLSNDTPKMNELLPIIAKLKEGLKQS